MGTYYNLRERGEQPREMRVGKRAMISVEAAADWRRDRERHHKQHVAKERANPARTSAARGALRLNYCSSDSATSNPINELRGN
jgi:hypothetical protein